ncbi:hypothetical protein GXP67_17655 [Rhodocytophaga rosea]|uniref:NnrS family protein n=1 Tax=Rhodocytophaga rosea TaxID=2704465 RepID=A0A6C0GJX2_9BACT|nr:hypothetical protein [Rhodocytophaga rosea]QHT68336.1 hypothetical protein GXP67_17655 [Rhodocytophaga rosea]
MSKPAPFLLPVAILSALTGVVTGLYRIGWVGFPANAAGEHGAIMVGCFMGTLISLERAVALQNRYALFVPAIGVGSLIAFLAGFKEAAYILLIITSIGLTGITFYLQSRLSSTGFVIAFTGAICWLLGNVMLVLWNMYPVAVSWWMGFILLTIVSSRLKSSISPEAAKFKFTTLYLVIGLVTAGLLMPFHGTGRYVMGAGLACTALWLLKYDAARESMKGEEVNRYSGLLILTGFMWLFITGIFMLWGDLYGPLYDTVLHSFFIGFLFSVVMAHGPLILPNILALPIKPFHKLLYIWSVLLQGSLIVRIIANFLAEFELRKWSGVLNGIAILVFFVNMAILLAIEVRKAKNQKNNPVKNSAEPVHS